MASGIKKRWVRNYLLVILMISLVLCSIFVVTVKTFYYNLVYKSLYNRAEVSAGFYNRYIISDDYSFDDISKLIIKDFNEKEKLELQIIDNDGVIKYSSSGFNINYKINSSDVEGAINGEQSNWEGKDEYTNEKISAVAIPLVNNNGIVIGTIRYVSSLSKVDNLVYELFLYMLFIIILIIMLLLILSLTFSKSILKPVNEIIGVSKKMALGEMNERITDDYNDEFGELATTLNHMADEIQKTETMKNEFISSISHEIRTPLTAIAGWGETIITGEFENKDEVEKGLKIIIKETARLSNMVNELLDFSRMENSKFTLYLEEVLIDEEILQILQIYDAKTKSAGINLIKQFKFEGIAIEGDSSRLRQVFINLLDNAIKFTPEGKNIYIDIINKEESLEIVLQDEGIGIGSEDLKYVKDKFYKGKSKKSGSGIGLAVSDEIMKLHGGQLLIESKEKKGTKATMRISKM